MAKQIKLTPELLKSQAADLSKLADDYDAFLGTIYQEITNLNGNWSTKLAQNFVVKITKTKSLFDSLVKTLNDGSKSALEAATRFEEADGSISIEQALSDALYDNGAVDKDLNRFWEEYLEIIRSQGTSEEKVKETIAWLKEILAQNSEILDNLPPEIKEALTLVDDIDIGVGLVESLTEYFSNLNSGSIESQIDSVVDVVDHVLDPLNLPDNNPYKMLVNQIENMLGNWLTAINEETSVTAVYKKTFMDSTLKTVNSAVDATIGQLYDKAKGVTDKVGLNLEALYENLSDKTGVDAVKDVFSQLGDEIRENVTWENWKSGVKLIFNGLFKRK